MAHSLKINLSTLGKKGSALKNFDFVYNLYTIHLYSRLFGLVPFSIFRDSSGEVQRAHVSKLDLLWFVISISFYFYLAYAYWVVTSEMHYVNGLFVLRLGDTLLIGVGLIYSGAICIMDMYNRSRIVEFLKKFILFDKNVSKFICRLEDLCYINGNMYIFLFHLDCAIWCSF